MGKAFAAIKEGIPKNTPLRLRFYLRACARNITVSRTGAEEKHQPQRGG
jgi:hypothetical protein